LSRHQLPATAARHAAWQERKGGEGLLIRGGRGGEGGEKRGLFIRGGGKGRRLTYKGDRKEGRGREGSKMNSAGSLSGSQFGSDSGYETVAVLIRVRSESGSEIQSMDPGRVYTDSAQDA